MDVGRGHTAREGRLVCIREDHSESALAQNDGDPVNTIAAVSLVDGSQRVLVAGNDFYTAPRLSPDGQHLAWLTWNHPNMPWDGTELWWLISMRKARVRNQHLVAGGIDESIFCPVWSPDGVLTFASDRSGWWNLYRWEDGASLRCLLEMEAEFGVPQWGLGSVDPRLRHSFDHRLCLLPEWNRPSGIPRRTNRVSNTNRYTYTSISGILTDGQRVVFRGGAPTLPGAIVSIDLASGAQTVIKRSMSLDIDPGYLSVPESLAFPSEEGRTAYGLFYAPNNRTLRLRRREAATDRL